MATFDDIVRAVEQAKEEAAWKKGAEGRHVHIAERLQEVWHLIKSRLDPSNKGVPVSCVRQEVIGERTIVSKCIFKTTANNVVSYGFDIVAEIDGLTEQITVAITEAPTRDPQTFQWNFRVGDKLLSATPIHVGGWPSRVDPGRIADMAIDGLRAKFIEQASS